MWDCCVALQIGRAGRDGSESYCHLFLDDADFLRLRSLAHSDGIEASNALALLQAVFAHHSGGQAGDQGGEGPLYGTVAVAEVAEQCDMKQEVMETLLSYLEVRTSAHSQQSVPHLVCCRPLLWSPFPAFATRDKTAERHGYLSEAARCTINEA